MEQWEVGFMVKRIFLILLVGLFVFASSAGIMAAEQKGSASTTKKEALQVTVKGTVVAAGKDAKGNVNAVAIKSDKGEYKVVLKGKGKDLLKMVGKKVEVTGKLREAKGKKSINVSDFKEASE